MHTQPLLIINRLGLHARAAAKLIQTAGQFESDIQLIKGEGEAAKTVDAKSMLSVLMLAAGQGTQLTLRATGSDAEAAIAAITALVENRFDEEE